MKKLLLTLVLFAFSLSAFSAECNIARDKNGKIKRSSWQLTKFRKYVACPATGKVQIGNKYTPCNGHVVDHIKPLCLCGRDHPSNMQWQTVAESKLKDVSERNACNGKGD